MASPVVPSEIEALVPSPGGNFCEKFWKSLQLPRLIWKAYKYFVTEDGNLTMEGAALFCSLNCKGTSGGSAGTPVISASDGTFLDRVQVTWTGVSGSTSYEVFRNVVNSTSTATLLGSTAVTSFDDTTAVAGTTYFYWVRAITPNGSGAFSAVDTGYVAAELDAVADLDATQGFYEGTSATYISLVWTPVTGATMWDVYRHTENNFAAATKIASSRVPYDNSASLNTGPSPTLVDNGGELVYVDQPPTPYDTYYYWVVPKSATGLGNQSNTATGWGASWGDGQGGVASVQVLAGTSYAVPPTAVRAWVVLFGGGGNGAAGGPSRGGGGGGAGAIVYGELPISGGTPTVRVTSTPSSIPARATSELDGSAVPETILEFAPDGVTFATKMTSDAGAAAALYSSSSNGSGGDGTSGSHSGITGGSVKDGRSGKSASGNKGGRSGYMFGGIAHPGAHFLPSHTGDGAPGLTPAGAGSYANLNALTYREGGIGQLGRVILIYRTS